MCAQEHMRKDFPRHRQQPDWAVVVAVHLGTLSLEKGSDDAIPPSSRNLAFPPYHQDQRVQSVGGLDVYSFITEQ